jgi:hypothetical protein
MQLATGEPITWALQVAQSNGSLVAEDIFLLNQLIKKGHVDEHPADNCVESAKTSDEPEQLYSITWSGRTEFRRLGAGKKVKRC